MAYMMMLVADDATQVSAVLKAWKSIHVDDMVFMDSVCYHRAGHGRPPIHIPMRFAFGPPDRGQQHCSVTLFGLAQDEATVQACIEQAELVMGDLDEPENGMLVAWPLAIVKGYPKQSRRGGEAAE